MKSINDRIAQCIQSSGLTKTAFAQRIGLTQAYVSALSIGRKSPSDRTISDICREFNISEDWLRTGEGEMFQPTSKGVLDDLAREYGLSKRGMAIVERFLDLKPDVQEAIADYIEKVVSSFVDEGSPTTPVFAAMPSIELTKPDADEQKHTQPDLAAELAEFKRQNREMAAKMAAMEEELALLEATEGYEALPSVSNGSFSPMAKK